MAEAADFFGMEVSYYNRREKEDCPYTYREKEDLFAESDIILTSIPRNQIVVGEEEFALMGNHKIFINVGVGPSFDQKETLRFLTPALFIRRNDSGIKPRNVFLFLTMWRDSRGMRENGLGKKLCRILGTTLIHFK